MVAPGHLQQNSNQSFTTYHCLLRNQCMTSIFAIMQFGLSRGARVLAPIMNIVSMKALNMTEITAEVEDIMIQAASEIQTLVSGT